MYGIKLMCIDIKRNDNGDITYCVLKDNSKNVRILTSSEVKSALRQEEFIISNIVIKEGKLVKL